MAPPLLSQRLQVLRQIETLAQGHSPLHRLDPRSKVLVTLALLIGVASLPGGAITPLLPLLAYPLTMVPLAGLSWRWLGRQLRPLTPLLLALVLSSPLLDPRPVPLPGGGTIAFGWCIALALLLRVLLCTSAVLLLVASTGMIAIARALRSFGLPALVVQQVLLLLRYLELLATSAERLDQARQLRSAGRRGLGLVDTAPLLGALLLRSLDRAERLQAAMALRGFDGALPARPLGRLSRADGLFLAGWGGAFLLWRCLLAGVPPLGAEP